MITKIQGEGSSPPTTPSVGKVRPLESGKTAGPDDPLQTATQETIKPAEGESKPAYGFRLRVDDETHEVVAVIVDPETEAVVREIPPEEMRKAAEVIRALIGQLVDRRV